MHPAFLPDGRRLLFRNVSSDPQWRGIYAASLDSKATTLVTGTTGIATPQSKVSVVGGHLLFVQESSLMAAPFDDARLRPDREAQPVAQTSGPFSVSEAGLLVYAQRSSLYQLAWVDRNGLEIEPLPVRGDLYAPTLSHDGRRVALKRFLEGEGTAGDIWVYDLARGAVGTRVTTDPSDDRLPLWSPDDEWLIFGANRSGRYALYRKRSTGVGREEAVFAPDFNVEARSWSRDGRSLIVNDSSSEQDLWSVSLPDAKASRLFNTPSKEWGGQISPDGKWIAYSSDETGQAEIYVQPFPLSGARWRISTAGGVWPKWRADGRELFFTDVNRRLMAVDVNFVPSFEAGVPRQMFDATTLRDIPFYFDVAADGQRFLVVKPAPAADARPITLVQNWMANLRR